MSKAILIIDIDDELFENCIDIENTQVTYIELECHNETASMSLVNHWLKPLPHKNKYDVDEFATIDYENDVTLGHYLNKGWNDCIDEILGEEE